jgi:streptogramin lyase
LRLFDLAMPALVAASAAIPTIPTIKPAGPATSGIVASEDGTVYFVDSFSRVVWRVQPTGAMTPFVTGRNGKTLQIDPEGNIYGTHDEGRSVVIWRADPAGNIVEIARTAMPEQHGHAFVLDDCGEVIGWTGNGKRTGVRVWRSHDRGRHLLAGGALGIRDGAGADARFLPIGGITLSDGGELYVTSGHTIRKITQQGEVSTIASDEPLLRARGSFLQRLFGLPELQGHLTGITVDDDGTVYVANPTRDAVVRIDRNGRASEVASSDGGWSPTGVAVSSGALYVLEYGSGVRVRKITGDGTSVVATVRPDRTVVSHQGYHPRSRVSLAS